MPVYSRELANYHNQLGNFLRNADRRQEAEIEHQKAQELWRQHPDPAIEHAKKAVATEPRNTHRWHDLGKAHFNSGEWQAAITAFEECNYLGSSAWQWFFMAIAHWQLDCKEEAYVWYFRSINWMEVMQEPQLRDMQAEAAALLGLPDPGERSEEAAMFVHEGNIHQQNGQIEKAKEDYGRAVALYESLAADFPMVPAYYKKLVDLLAKTGRQHEVEKTYHQAIGRLDDLAAAQRYDYLQIQIYRGIVHREFGNIDQAIADFSAVIVKDPKRTEVWDLRGNCYLQKDEWAKATTDYSEAIKLKPLAGWYWHERGFANLMLGEHKASIADHSESIRLREFDAGTRRRRGQSYKALGEFQKAEQDFTRAIEISSSDWENWHIRGQFYSERGEADKAVADFTKVIELKPNHPEAWSGRGGAYFHLKQWDKSVADFSKAIEEAPKVQDNWLQRGRGYLNLEQWDKAVANFGRVVYQWPNEPEGWYLRGVAFAQLNKLDEALADLRQAIAKGFKDKERMKNDSRLDSLRSNEDFKNLLRGTENEMK
jgi:tetratricopeptide (TPR) repeat protein